VSGVTALAGRVDDTRREQQSTHSNDDDELNGNLAAHRAGSQEQWAKRLS